MECVALGDIHLRSAWQVWHLVTSTLALGDIHLRFAWQVWHLVTFTFVLRGRCGTYGIVALGPDMDANETTRQRR